MKYSHHPDETLCTVSPDLKDLPKPDTKKYMDQIRCVLGPDVTGLQTLAFVAGERAKTPSFDRETIVTSVLAEWKRTRREPSSDQLAQLAEKSGMPAGHVTKVLADSRRSMYSTPGLRPLAEAAFDAGVRNQLRAANPMHEELLEKIVAFLGTETQPKRSTSPVDLGRRAQEFRDADPELSNVDAVRKAYFEAGVSLT